MMVVLRLGVGLNRLLLVTCMHSGSGDTCAKVCVVVGLGRARACLTFTRHWAGTETSVPADRAGSLVLAGFCRIPKCHPTVNNPLDPRKKPTHHKVDVGRLDARLLQHLCHTGEASCRKLVTGGLHAPRVICLDAGHDCRLIAQAGPAVTTGGGGAQLWVLHTASSLCLK